MLSPTTGAITASGSNGNGANPASGNKGSISITSNGALTTWLAHSRPQAATPERRCCRGQRRDDRGDEQFSYNGQCDHRSDHGAHGECDGHRCGRQRGVWLSRRTTRRGCNPANRGDQHERRHEGAGGAVVLNAASNVNVTSTITTTGGAAVVGGTHAGAAGGNVTITGIDRTVTGLITASGGAAVGIDQVGGTAGVVSSTGTGTLTTTGGVTTSTGAATGIGAGGVAGPSHSLVRP